MLNNKGLATGLIAIMIFLFVFAVATILVNVVWTNYNSSIQSLDSSIADNVTKEKIDSLTAYINWGDKLFMWLFIVLIISYLISAATIPTDQPLGFILFMAFMILIVFFAMLLSNIWVTFSNQSLLINSLGNIPLIDYVLTFYPTIIFFVGILGALIFFTRKNVGGNQGMIGGADFE